MTAATEYLDQLREESAYQRERLADAAERWGEVPEQIVLTERDPTDYSDTHELVNDTSGRKLGWEFVGRNYDTWQPIHKAVWPQKCRWCGVPELVTHNAPCNPVEIGVREFERRYILSFAGREHANRSK